MKTQINLRTLKAVALAASTEETLFYLNGVLLDIAPHRVIYVATDGHRMLVAHEALDAESEDGPFDLTGQFIVPNGVIKDIKITGRNAITHDILESEGVPATKLTLQRLGKIFTPIDGTFPDYRRVIPAPHKGAPKDWPHYNADYLATFAKFHQIMTAGRLDQSGCRYRLCAEDSSSPAAVLFDDLDAFGVIMPVRTYDPEWKHPSWLSNITSPKSSATV